MTAFICVRTGDQAIALERIDGRYAFSLALTVGGSLPLHVGAGPQALLAFSPEDEARELLDASQPLRRYTEVTLVETDEVMASLADARERGYVISNEDVTPGVAALGMPIYGKESSERPIASVSIAGLVTQVIGGEQQEKLADHLAEAANSISATLGHGIVGIEQTQPLENTGGAE